MKILDRMGLLMRADAHGVMDQLEERSLLLKQHLREAELELDHKRARARGARRRDSCGSRTGRRCAIRDCREHRRARSRRRACAARQGRGRAGALRRASAAAAPSPTRRAPRRSRPGSQELGERAGCGSPNGSRRRRQVRLELRSACAAELAELQRTAGDEATPVGPSPTRWRTRRWSSSCCADVQRRTRTLRRRRRGGAGR